MKAKNEVAEQFQAKIADEVIPAIRKHGAYMTPEKIDEILLNPDTIIKLATSLKEQNQKRLLLEQKVIDDTPKVLFADAVAGSDTSIHVGDLAKFICQNGVKIGRGRLFAWMRENGYLVKDGSNIPTQRSIENGWMEIKESVVETKNGTLVKDVLSVIDTGISNIDRQVKDFDERRKELKRQDITEYWQTVIGKIPVKKYVIKSKQ
ncbi:MAG: phage antirepressor KilAC domain-containing protein [Eubacteriales bacterium]|nr:phage antirepressor KilAC domain-containing protein [Eubacteriales bacterium]